MSEEGPLTLRFRFLAEWLLKRGMRAQPVSADEAINIADTIMSQLPHLAAMESQPVPARFRVITGGAAPSCEP